MAKKQDEKQQTLKFKINRKNELCTLSWLTNHTIKEKIRLTFEHSFMAGHPLWDILQDSWPELFKSVTTIKDKMMGSKKIKWDQIQ